MRFGLGLVVTPSSLGDAVAQLRKVLGPGHIATVPPRGHRLVTLVVPVVPAVVEAATPPVATSRAAHTAEPRLGSRSVALLPFIVRGLPESLLYLRKAPLAC